MHGLVCTAMCYSGDKPLSTELTADRTVAQAVACIVGIDKGESPGDVLFKYQKWSFRATKSPANFS